MKSYCPLTRHPVHEVEVWHGLTYHRLGLYLSAIFAVIAILVSFYLIMMHATHYLRPWEQRQYVSPAEKKKSKRLIGGQYYPNLVPRPYLRGCLLPLLRLLYSLRLFRNPSRFLRGHSHCRFLYADLPLCRPGSTPTEELFSNNSAQEVDLAHSLGPEVFWGRTWRTTHTSEWLNMVQRECDALSESSRANIAVGDLGWRLPILLHTGVDE